VRIAEREPIMGSERSPHPQSNTTGFNIWSIGGSFYFCGYRSHVVAAALL
jgi:hypothetical protein